MVMALAKQRQKKTINPCLSDNFQSNRNKLNPDFVFEKFKFITNMKFYQ